MSNMRLRNLLLSCALGAMLALALCAWAPWRLARPVNQHTRLSAAAMSRLWGADACRSCRYVGSRLDECFHESWADPCDPTGCIANYAIDNTCDLGIGSCNALKDNTAAGAVQYYRADSGCTTNNPTKWATWMTQYYGSTCSTLTRNVRCQKTNGGCNGSLIESGTREPGIICY